MALLTLPSRVSRAVFFVVLGALLAVVLGLAGSSLIQRADAGKTITYTKFSGAGGATVGFHSVTASCDNGDTGTGGGFEDIDAGTTQVNSSSPFTSIGDPITVDSWTLDYTAITNQEPGGARALVVCLDKKPLHAP